MVSGFRRRHHARADFVGSLVRVIFDWKIYAAAVFGWLVSFLVLVTISEWSAAGIWAASIAASLGASFIYRLAFSPHYSPPLIKF